jgi:hypothetical protein
MGQRNTPPKPVRERLAAAATRLHARGPGDAYDAVTYMTGPAPSAPPPATTSYPFAVKLARLTAERTVLIGYLRVKAEAEDWHAVADAAMDLRELDAHLTASREWAK